MTLGHAAAAGGHVDTVAYLLSQGLEFRKTTNSDNYTALHLAAQNGHAAVIECLLENKDVLLRPQKSKAACLAASNGHIEALRILLSGEIRDLCGCTAAHRAVYDHNAEALKRIISLRRDLAEIADDAGNLPLHDAANLSRTSVVEYLVELRPGLLDARNKKGETPFHIACAGSSKLKMLQALIGHRKDLINTRNDNNETPLHTSVNQPYSNEEVIKYIISLRPEFRDSVDDKSHTPIWYAVEHHSLKNARCLRTNGAFIDAKAKEFLATSLPLHSAVIRENERFVAVQLDEGASTEEINSDGLTPLQVAAQKGLVSILKLLVGKGALVSAKTPTGLTALHMCMDKSAIEYILDEQEDLLDATTLEGFTPLHTAVANGWIDASKVLLSRGAKVDAVTSEGLTPVHIAAQKGNLEILTLLVDNHAKIGLKTPDGSTALHLAAASDRVDIIKFLIKAEKRLVNDVRGFTEIRNSSGWTAFCVAALKHHSKSMKVLQNPCYWAVYA